MQRLVINTIRADRDAIPGCLTDYVMTLDNEVEVEDYRLYLAALVERCYGRDELAILMGLCATIAKKR